MDKQTEGTVVSVKKQWWLKVNTKMLRMGPMDGATFPHIAKVKYSVDGTEYSKLVWINAGHPVPKVGDTVHVRYRSDKPKKAKVL